MSETSNRSSTTTRHDNVCAIRKLSEAWIAAVRAKDLERLLSMITDDAVFLCASIGTIRGKDMVAAIYRDTFAKYDIDQTFVIEEIEVMGDRAYVWGSERNHRHSTGRRSAGSASWLWSGHLAATARWVLALSARPQ